MTGRQLRSMAMYKMVMSVFEQYEDRWKHIEALQEAIARFRKYRSSIIEANALLLSMKGSGAIAKNDLKKQICASLATIVRVMQVLALRTHNDELAKKVRVTHHSLSRTRDHAFTARCIGLLGLAEANANILEPYGIAPEQLADLRSLCDRYQASLAVGKQQLHERPQITKELSKLFIEASAMLRKEIDPLMKVLEQEHPGVALHYFDARVLKKLPGRKKKRAERSSG